MSFRKADQLTFNTRYTLDGYILSVFTCYGNKIKFSYGANYEDFCLDSHKFEMMWSHKNHNI